MAGKEQSRLYTSRARVVSSAQRCGLSMGWTFLNVVDDRVVMKCGDKEAVVHVTDFEIFVEELMSTKMSTVVDFE